MQEKIKKMLCKVNRLNKWQAIRNITITMCPINMNSLQCVNLRNMKANFIKAPRYCGTSCFWSLKYRDVLDKALIYAKLNLKTFFPLFLEIIESLQKNKKRQHDI